MAIKITRAADVGFGDKVPEAIPESVAPPVVPGFVDTSQKDRAIADGLSKLSSVIGVKVKENREKVRIVQEREERSRAAVDLIDIQFQRNRGSQGILSDPSLSPKEKADKQSNLVRQSRQEYEKRIPEHLRYLYNAPYATSSLNNMEDFSNKMVAQADEYYRADTAGVLARGAMISSEFPAKREAMRSIVHKRIDETPMESVAKVKMKAKYDRDVDLADILQRSAVNGGAIELLDALKERGDKGGYNNFRGITVADRYKYIEETEAAAVTDEAMTSASDVWDKFEPEDDIAPVDRGLMMDALERKIKDPDTLKEARSFLMADINDHNADIAARSKSNLSAIFEAHEKGTPIIDIRSLPEYVALSGKDKRDSLSLMRSDNAKKGKAVEKKAAADAWFFFSLKTTQEIKDMTVTEYYKEWYKMSEGDRGEAEDIWKAAHKEGAGEVGVISLKTIPSHLWQSWRLGKPSDKKNAQIFNTFVMDYDAEIRSLGYKPKIEEAKNIAKRIMTESILIVVDENWFTEDVTRLPGELKPDEKVLSMKYKRNVPSTQPQGGITSTTEAVTGINPENGERIEYKDGQWQKIP